MRDPKRERPDSTNVGPSDAGTVPHRRGVIAATAFGAVCVASAPVMAVGYALWLARLYRGRSSGLSATAQGPLPGFEVVGEVDDVLGLGAEDAKRLSSALGERQRRRTHLRCDPGRGEEAGTPRADCS